LDSAGKNGAALCAGITRAFAEPSLRLMEVEDFMVGFAHCRKMKPKALWTAETAFGVEKNTGPPSRALAKLIRRLSQKPPGDQQIDLT
jgi:hypothetical protein